MRQKETADKVRESRRNVGPQICNICRFSRHIRVNKIIILCTLKVELKQNNNSIKIRRRVKILTFYFHKYQLEFYRISLTEYITFKLVKGEKKH